MMHLCERNMFAMQKSKNYIIYGAANGGKQVYAGMKKAGYSVSAFLDKRADLLKEVEGIHVYHPEVYREKEKKNTVIIIAIANPFEHPKVADYLSKMGFSHIIFNSLIDDGSCGFHSSIKKIYNQIISGKIDESTEVPEFNSDANSAFLEDGAMIREDADCVAAFVPIEIIFGGKPEWVENWSKADEKANADVVASFDKPVFYSELPIIELFQAFEGFDNSTEKIEKFRQYLKRNPWRYYSFSREETAIDELLSNRYNLYMQMNTLLNLRGLDFFINDAPVLVRWNQKGYFNVLDGVHRICFFIAKGIHYIPSIMKKADYEKWIHRDALIKCKNYLCTHECPSAYTPVPHPNFINYPTLRDNFGVSRLQRIFKKLAEVYSDFSRLKVIELGSFFSYFAQAFSRLGSEVTTVEVLPESYELGKLLNELLYCPNIHTICSDIELLPANGQYDILLELTVIYPYIHTEKGDRMMMKIDRLTKSMMIWESGDDPKGERQYIMERTSFIRYEKIADTFGTGKVRELGIFYKE